MRGLRFLRNCRNVGRRNAAAKRRGQIGREGQRAATDANAVFVSQFSGFLDGLVVHQRSIARTEVAHHPSSVLGGYFGMFSAHQIVIDDDLAFGRTSDRYRLRGVQAKNIRP